MAEKIPVEIKAFGGINKNHNRSIGNPSTGKNFVTRNGALISRPGLREIYNPPNVSTPIYSLHTGKQAQSDERFLVQAGNILYHRREETGPWNVVLAAQISGYGYGNLWREHLIVSFGGRVIDYNITQGGYDGDLRDGGCPGCLQTATWKDYVWSVPGADWAPAYRLHFNGYEYETVPVDPDDPGGETKDVIVDRDIHSWPEDFHISISDGTAIVAAIPFGSSLFILTEASTWHIYGNTEDDFEVHQGSRIGAFKNNIFSSAALVSDVPMWIGNDKKVYIYTGSTVEPISQPIDELLEAEFAIPGTFPRVYSLENKFWLFMLRNILANDPIESTTKAFVYDPAEKEWYIYEFPDHVLSACVYNNKVHLGTKNGKILVMDDQSSINFETSLTIGPFSLQSRVVKLKKVKVTAEPRNDFNITVYTQVDNNPEVKRGILNFESGKMETQEIKIIGAKGKNISVRLSSTDQVNELQEVVLTVAPKAFK